MKTALITGASKGIGLSMAKTLLRNNFFIYVNYRKEDEWSILAKKELSEIGDHFKFLKFDVNEPQQIAIAREKFKHKGLSVLINNAGILISELLYSLDMDDFTKVLNTNLYGAINVYHSYKTLLKASGEKSSVINISSISGIIPRKGQGAYGVSKAMLTQWTKEMAQFHQASNLSFYTISPGPVETDLIQDTPWKLDLKAHKRIPLQRILTVEEIANMVLMLCSEHTLKSGSNLIYDGGFINTVNL